MNHISTFADFTPEPIGYESGILVKEPTEPEDFEEMAALDEAECSWNNLLETLYYLET